MKRYLRVLNVGLVVTLLATIGSVIGTVGTAAAFTAGEGSGTSWCGTYGGTNLGSYDNIYACYGPSAPPTPFNPGYGGFQCTELANRYLYNVNGDTVFGDSLVGGNFVSTVSSQYGISTGSSGGSAMPVAGDIISMWGGSSGEPQSGGDTHVAIVTSVSGGSITTLNQNDVSDSNGDNGFNTITVSGSSWSFNGGFYSTFEWLNLVASTPGPPGTPTAVAGDTTATVSFSPPSSSGSSPISSYTVTSTPGGFTTSGSGSPITVVGLANETSYTFTVTATNKSGTGPSSSPSNLVTPYHDTHAYVTSATNADGTIELFAIGLDNNIYQNRESSPDSSSWDGWTQLQGGNATSITATHTKNGSLGVFFIATDGQVHYYFQTKRNVDNWTAMQVLPAGLHS
jgi:hypothetical protein